MSILLRQNPAVFEPKYWLKGCATMQKFVIEVVFEIVTEVCMIEICMEQTQLFQYNRFHYADFRAGKRV